MSEDIVDDEPPKSKSVEEFIAQFFENVQDSPASDHQFIQSAKKCGQDTDKWDSFIQENISLADRERFRSSLIQWLAKATNKQIYEQDKSLVLKAYSQVSSGLIIVKDLREPRLSYLPLKQLDEQVKKSIGESVASNNFTQFLGSQARNILKILENKSSLLSYFEEVKLSILKINNRHLALYKLFKEMTFTDFLILLQSATYYSQKISKYLLFEQAAQTPILYEFQNTFHSNQNFIKYIQGLVRSKQCALILNAGSQKTSRSGKTSFLTRLVGLDGRYTEDSSFPNTLNLYSKFQPSSKVNLIVADFNGFLNKDTYSILQRFGSLSSVLLLHVSEKQLSKNTNIFQDDLFVKLLRGQNWEKIIVFVRDFERQTEKKLKSKVPSQFKEKMQLCFIPNLEDHRGKRSQISLAQSRAINIFKKAIQNSEVSENKTKIEEEENKKQLKPIFDQNRGSYEQQVQDACQLVINQHLQWNFQKDKLLNKQSIFKKIESVCEEGKKSIFKQFKVSVEGKYKQQSDLNDFEKEIEKIVNKKFISFLIVCRRKLERERNQFKEKVDQIYIELAIKAHKKKQDEIDRKKAEKSLQKPDHNKKNDKDKKVFKDQKEVQEQNNDKIMKEYKKSVIVELNKFTKENINATTINNQDLIDPSLRQDKAKFSYLQASLEVYRRIAQTDKLLQQLLPKQSYQKALFEQSISTLEEAVNRQLGLFMPEIKLHIIQQVTNLKDLHNKIHNIISWLKNFVESLAKTIKNVYPTFIEKDFNDLMQKLQEYMTGIALKIGQQQIEMRRKAEYQVAITYFNNQIAIRQIELQDQLKENEINQDHTKKDTVQNAVKKIKFFLRNKAANKEIKQLFGKQLDYLGPDKMIDILQDELTIPPDATKQELKKVFKNYYKFLKNQNKYLFELMCKESFITFRNDNVQILRQAMKNEFHSDIEDTQSILKSKDIKKILNIFSDAKIRIKDKDQKQQSQQNKINSFAEEIVKQMDAQKEEKTSLSSLFSDQQIILLIDNCIKNDFKNDIIGCDQQCPFCGVKCQLPFNHNGDHKPRQNSHLLTAFAGVNLSLTNQFSLFICRSATHMSKRVWFPQKSSKVSMPNAKWVVSTRLLYKRWDSVFPNQSNIHLFQSTDKLEYYKMIWANLQAVMISTKYRDIIPNIIQSSDPNIIKYKQQNDFLTNGDLQEFEVDPFTQEEYRLVDF